MQLLDYETKYNSLPARLYSSLKNKTLGHSYIIHGDSIEEIKEFAMELIKTCVCEKPIKRGCCGECSHCRLISVGSYPEMFILEPESKARFIRADDVRLFQNRFYLKAAVGVLKVGVIFESDRMNPQAQNVFLKTLEEPPPGTLLILLTTRLNSMLNTIRSRCRLVSLAANRVQYENELSSQVQESLAHIAGKDGAEAALKAVDQFKDIFTGLKKKAQDEIEASFIISPQENEDSALRKKFKEKLAALIEGRYRMYREQIVSMLEVWIGQNYLLANGVSESQLSHPELAADQWAYNSEDGASTLKITDDFRRDLQMNVNEELALENFFLQICERN